MANYNYNPDPKYGGYDNNSQYNRPPSSGPNNPNGSNGFNSNDTFASCPEGKSRGVAALLAIFLGGLGIQYFYLNKISAGFITILLSILTCGVWEIVMFAQGIYMFCINNHQFRQKYVLSTSTLPLF